MKKILLDENDIPKNWYNIQADLKTPLDPPLNPKTKKPIGPEDLSAIFPIGLIKQEVSQERFIPIPEEIRDIYRMWRPSPLYRANKLEKFLKYCPAYSPHCRVFSQPTSQPSQLGVIVMLPAYKAGHPGKKENALGHYPAFGG